MPAATISSTSPELMLADNSACVLIFMMALSLDSLYARSLSSISSAAASNTVHPWFAAISRSASAHHTPRHQLRLESGEHCAAKWDRPLGGGAIFPVIQGLFADRIGIQQAFFVPI